MGYGETNEQLGKGERAAQKVETHPTYIHLASNDELAMNSRVKPLPLLGRFDTPSPSAPLALMMSHSPRFASWEVKRATCGVLLPTHSRFGSRTDVSSPGLPVWKIGWW